MNLNYVAGFFDGEGCIGFGKAKDAIFPRIFVVNTNRDILEDLKKSFGGDIQPLPYRKSNWKIGYAWRLSWTKACLFLDKIYPFLKIKRKQAELIQVWNEYRAYSGNDIVLDKESKILLVESMHWLNKKGNKRGINPLEVTAQQFLFENPDFKYSSLKK